MINEQKGKDTTEPFFLQKYSYITNKFNVFVTERESATRFFTSDVVVTGRCQCYM